MVMSIMPNSTQYKCVYILLTYAFSIYVGTSCSTYITHMLLDNFLKKLNIGTANNKKHFT